MKKQLHFLIDGRVDKDRVEEHYKNHSDRFNFYNYLQSSPNISCEVNEDEYSAVDLMVRVVKRYLISVISNYADLSFNYDKVRELAIYVLFFYFYPIEKGIKLNELISNLSFFQGISLWDYEVILPLTYFTETGFTLFNYSPLDSSNEVYFRLDSDIKDDLDILLTNLCLPDSYDF